MNKYFKSVLLYTSISVVTYYLVVNIFDLLEHEDEPQQSIEDRENLQYYYENIMNKSQLEDKYNDFVKHRLKMYEKLLEQKREQRIKEKQDYEDEMFLNYCKIRYHNEFGVCPYDKEGNLNMIEVNQRKVDYQVKHQFEDVKERIEEIMENYINVEEDVQVCDIKL